MAYGFDYSYEDNGKLASLEGSLYIAGFGTTIGAFRSEFTYGENSLNAKHYRWQNKGPESTWLARTQVEITYDAQQRVLTRTISCFNSCEENPNPEPRTQTVNTYSGNQLSKIEIFDFNGFSFPDGDPKDAESAPIATWELECRVSFGYNNYGLPVRIDVTDIDQYDGEDVEDRDDSYYATIKWETRQLPPSTQAIIAGLFGKAEGLFDTYFGLTCAGGLGFID
ncbi:MAG: hypothetical protein BWY87_00809 [Deltaproteobacteria bacterium ADurb.Bin510]|nr:MAG: hypothetical protein BWY87_00809 [Deltaproteobacteria bacterium ADurb.Bin510]